MTHPSLVSVLMPAYNHEMFIEQAIESVLNQSYKNIELLIYDDCSSDRTPLLAKSMANRYPDRIVLYNGRKNRGVSNRFNYLCSKARGAYIAPFASDDHLPVDGIEQRVAFLNSNPEIDIVATEMEVIDESGRVLTKAEQTKTVPQFNRLYHTDFKDLYGALLSGNFLPAGSLCIRMKRISKHQLHHDELCPNLHDYDVWLKLAQRFRWGFLPYPTFRYRWHGKNFSAPQNHDIKSLSNVVSQSIYILSKQLLVEQNNSQRLITINNLFEYCRSLSEVIPTIPGSNGTDHESPYSNDSNAGIRKIPSTNGGNERTGRNTSHEISRHKEYNTVKVRKLLRMGKDLLDAGKLKESCDTFIKVLDIDAVNLEAVTNLGIISMHANNTKKAQYFFKRAVEIDPSCKERLKRYHVT